MRAPTRIDETSRRRRGRFWDRTTERPAAGDPARRRSPYARGPFRSELGKQFVRWGQTDILAPTDRFAPRDYLTVAGERAARRDGRRVDRLPARDTLSSLVYTPRLTPSRMPILTHRWIGLRLRPRASGFEVRDTGAQFPRRSQYGLRWNHVGRWFEHSIAFFQGFNRLPLLAGRVESRRPARST